MLKTSSKTTTLYTTYKMKAPTVLYSTIASICAITLITILTKKAIYFAVFALLLTPLLTSITYLLALILRDPIVFDLHKTNKDFTFSIEEKKQALGGWGQQSDSGWA